MATVNQVFPMAPMGRRIILTFALVLGILLLFLCGNLYVGMTKMKHVPLGGRVVQTLSPLVPLLILVSSFLWERSQSSQIAIEDNVLVLRRKRYPLEGLTAAVRDPQVLVRARKRFGNSGVGSIRGKFRSKRIGDFEAFLTDPENAVVLTWPERIVAVSPADTDFFIYSARAAAGLK